MEELIYDKSAVYESARLLRDPLPVGKPLTGMSVEQRFWSRVDKTDGCWNWTGATVSGGYGVFRINGRRMFVHRYAAALHFGMFDQRLFVCHRCDNPRCVRFDHLRLGDQSSNMLEMYVRLRR